jgi:hypothetical protein
LFGSFVREKKKNKTTTKFLKKNKKMEILRNEPRDLAGRFQHTWEGQLFWWCKWNKRCDHMHDNGAFELEKKMDIHIDNKI